MQFINTFHNILDSYDLFIVDIWGVVHNDGLNTFDGVLDLLSEIQKRGKRLSFLSNAPKRISEIHQVLADIGITKRHYNLIHTSGEETHLLLKENQLNLGKKCFVFIDDYAILDGTDISSVPLEEADFILGSGISNRNDITFYDPIIQKILNTKDFVWLCPNPDLFVSTIDGYLICPGAVAKRYEDFNKKVIYIGKPYAQAYSRILSTFNDIEKNRVLCIGDSLLTDIKGAASQGLDSALILRTGVHYKETFYNNEICHDLVDQLCTKHNIFPNFIASFFK